MLLKKSCNFPDRNTETDKRKSSCSFLSLTARTPKHQHVQDRDAALQLRKVPLLPLNSVSVQVVGISLDTTSTLLSWPQGLQHAADGRQPVGVRGATIDRAFGILQKVFSSDPVKTGFPANVVFIVDRVRHHTVLDSRVAFYVEEAARLVAAYSHLDWHLACHECNGNTISIFLN
jgi:hypothetical protein